MESSKSHQQIQEWLQAMADGELESVHRGQLRRHLEACPECRARAARLERLVEGLERHKVEARRGFAEQVMESLPDAAWEVRRPAALAVSAVVVVTLLVAAAWIAGYGSETGQGWSGALVGLFSEAAVAGAGLVGASWRGLGLGLAELWRSSTGSAIVVAILVVLLDLLLWRGLAGRRAAVTRSRESKRSGTEGHGPPST